jgi:hypothetical protein
MGDVHYGGTSRIWIKRIWTKSKTHIIGGAYPFSFCIEFEFSLTSPIKICATQLINWWHRIQLKISNNLLLRCGPSSICCSVPIGAHVYTSEDSTPSGGRSHWRRICFVSFLYREVKGRCALYDVSRIWTKSMTRPYKSCLPSETNLRRML